MILLAITRKNNGLIRLATNEWYVHRKQQINNHNHSWQIAHASNDKVIYKATKNVIGERQNLDVRRRQLYAAVNLFTMSSEVLVTQR